MKNIILTASWFAVAVYCLLTGVYGPAGLRMTTQANESAAAMVKNIDSLKKLNEDYASEWHALQNDPSLTAVQGRSLGYIASDEVVVRVALPSSVSSPPFIGERVLFSPGRSLTVTGIRLATVYVWLFLLLSGLARKVLKGRKPGGMKYPWENRFQREMRVQDASRT